MGQGTQLLYIKTQCARDPKLHETAQLVPAFIEHSAINKIHDEVGKVGTEVARDRDAGVLSHELQGCTFGGRRALDDERRGYTIHRHARCILGTETTLQLFTPNNVLRVTHKSQDVGVSGEGRQFRGNLQYCSRSAIRVKYRYSHWSALLGEVERSKPQRSRAHKTKTSRGTVKHSIDNQRGTLWQRFPMGYV